MCVRLLAVLVIVALAGCGRAGPKESDAGVESPALVFRNVTEADVAFVGDAACFDCHEDEWRGYQEHGMARSFSRIDSSHLDADLPSSEIQDSRSGLVYRVFRDGDAIYQEEFIRGPSGVKEHRLVRRADYVVGSGTAARTFLTDVGGRLYEMPVTWYTQTRKWAFSPGYDVANDRFNRLIPEGCVSCHANYPESVPFVQGKYASLPKGIGCERCHGPGALHVDERLSVPERGGTYDDTIVNPAHLDLDRELDVCQQCHLHGTVSLLREGRHYFDYRPSERLEDHAALYAAEGGGGADVDEISVISHADRMKQSACFTATAATDEPMTCVTCHNPHEGFRDRGPSYFSETCIGCHSLESLSARIQDVLTAAEHGAESACASCHMPRVEAVDAPHSSFTDHRIRVVNDAPADAAPVPAVSHTAVSLKPVFARDSEGPDAALYRGMAFVAFGRQKADTAAFEQGIRLLADVVADDSTRDEAMYLLGWARLALGRAQEAVPALESSVRARPGDPERLNTLAQAYEASGRNSAVVSRLYRRALSIQPELATVRINYGRFLQTGGDYAGAAAEYRRALESQPTLELAAFNLGTIGMDLEAYDEAETWFKKALELNPLYGEAMGNLGTLYLMQGDVAKGKKVFEQAVERLPDNATALGNLGALLVNEGAPERAIPLLLRAIRIDPVYVDALANLSLAYFRADDYARSRQYARRTLDVDGENALARQVMLATE